MMEMKTHLIAGFLTVACATFGADPGDQYAAYLTEQRAKCEKLRQAWRAAGTTAEVFNPVSGTFTAIGTLQKSRVEHTATLLSDGSVLVAGGYDDTGACCIFPPYSSMERYVPGTGFVGAGSMQVARYQHTASSLADGTTLFAGTYGWSSIGGRTAEVYDPATAVALVSVAPPVGTAGAAYAGFTLIGSGGIGGPYTITHRSGALPDGLSYNSSTRTISGTPVESGPFTMTFTVSDTVNNENSQTLTLRIDPLTITTTGLPNAQRTVPYTTQLVATGLAPIAWTLSPGSALPAGLTLNTNGTITGTPTTVQFASFSVRATDAVGQVALRQLSISVVNP